MRCIYTIAIPLLVAGCGPRPPDCSSPDELLSAYRQCLIASDVRGTWSLFGEEHRARFPGGMGDLKGLAARRVDDVIVRAKTIRDDRALFHMTIAWSKDDPVEKGGVLLERIHMKKREGRWYITGLGPDYE